MLTRGVGGGLDLVDCGGPTSTVRRAGRAASTDATDLVRPSRGLPTRGRWGRVIARQRLVGWWGVLRPWAEADTSRRLWACGLVELARRWAAGTPRFWGGSTLWEGHLPRSGAADQLGRCGHTARRSRASRTTLRSHLPVGGFSAYFTTLVPEVQGIIISRTEHNA